MNYDKPMEKEGVAIWPDLKEYIVSPITYGSTTFSARSRQMLLFAAAFEKEMTRRWFEAQFMSDDTDPEEIEELGQEVADVYANSLNSSNDGVPASSG